MGWRDLVVFAFAEDESSTARYLEEQVDTIPGVASTRSSLVTGVVSEGSTWRSGVLSERQQLSVPPCTGWAGGRLDSLERRITSALVADGRMGANDIAAHCNTSPANIRRRLPALIDTRRVLVRTDLTQPVADSPVAAVFFVEVAERAIPEAGRRIALLPGTRVCLNVAGRINLVVEVWLPDTGHVRDFEILLDNQQLALAVRDRSIILRNFKQAYRILDDNGRAVRVVPYNFGVMAAATS